MDVCGGELISRTLSEGEICVDVAVEGGKGFRVTWVGEERVRLSVYVGVVGVCMDRQ